MSSPYSLASNSFSCVFWSPFIILPCRFQRKSFMVILLPCLHNVCLIQCKFFPHLLIRFNVFHCILKIFYSVIMVSSILTYCYIGHQNIFWLTVFFTNCQQIFTPVCFDSHVSRCKNQWAYFSIFSLLCQILLTVLSLSLTKLAFSATDIFKSWSMNFFILTAHPSSHSGHFLLS